VKDSKAADQHSDDLLVQSNNGIISLSYATLILTETAKIGYDNFQHSRNVVFLFWFGFFSPIIITLKKEEKA